MSEPILPLRQWPAGIQQASVPANDNALRLEAMSRPVLGVADDEESGTVDGDVWIVGSTPTGAFASFDENDLALYHVNETTEVGGWHAWAPVEGLRVVVNDVRKAFDGSAWIDDPSGGGGSGDVVGPASSGDSHVALFDGATGKLLKDGGALGGMAGINDAPSDGTGYVRKDGAWAAESGGGGGGMTNPMTTAGDIIYGGSSGTPTRLAASTDGYVLTLVSGAPAWAAAGGGSLTGFTASLETASPNNTVNASVLIASGGTTNQDAVVSPKGSGAFQLQRADNISAGGQKRGTFSVDLQLTRSNAAQVVSGAYAFGAGANNTVSGQYAAAIGYSNTASGQASFACGDGCNASGVASYALGRYSHTRGVEGLFAYGGGLFGAVGDAQRFRATLRVATTNATPAVATTNGSAASATNQIPLVNNSAVTVKAVVTVRENATGDTASWDVNVCCKRGANAASTAIVGTASVTSIGADAGAATWALAVSADTTNGSLKFDVTGEASHNLRWLVDVYAGGQVAG